MKKYNLFRSIFRYAILLWAGIFININCYADLTGTIEKVRASVVGVGTIQQIRVPKIILRATGFVVSDGLHIITSAHVIPDKLKTSRGESLAIFIGRGRQPEVRKATVLMVDQEHDLALLKVAGQPLPPMQIDDSNRVREGDEYLFTGFPIGAVLGLYPVTHRGMISSITPVVIPAMHGRKLTSKQIKRLKAPYNVFQLDATAYPGNSGSPLYDPDTGKVKGVLNMILIKETKENILSKPSGIAYAIPANHVRALLGKLGL